MSMELANEKWLDGDESGLLGQFATNLGYTELIKAARGYPALTDFFREGITTNVSEVRLELGEMASKSPDDVLVSLTELLKLSAGQQLLVITDGVGSTKFTTGRTIPRRHEISSPARRRTTAMATRRHGLRKP